MNPSTTQPKHSLSALPPEIQVIFEDERITATTTFLREHYELTDEQLNAFEAELAITLLGLAYISDLQTRAKEALQATDETVLDILDDVAVLLLTPNVMAVLSAMEEQTKALESGELRRTIPAPAPAPTTDKKPEPKPGIVANPPEKVVPKGNVATIKKAEQASVPTGKMVGLKKEETESSIKGMRTMRGDINRLRGPEGGTDNSDTLQKPFEGK